jgi:hypothetical protein
MGALKKTRLVFSSAKIRRTPSALTSRHVMLSAQSLPTTARARAATGCHTRFFRLATEHTCANAPGFRDGVPPPPPLSRLPMDFGRIVPSVKPYSPGLPLPISTATVPPDGVSGEVPQLDWSYCAMQRHCLHTSLAFRLSADFPRPMFHSGWGTQVVLHRRRTTASCLWLYIAPQRTLEGAVTRLSYPEVPGFPRYQLRQVSPCSPHASLHAHQPSCAARVTLFRYVPRVGLSDFHSQPGHQAISCLTPFHGRPTSIVLVPRFSLVVALQRMGSCDWVERGNFTPERPA